MTSVLRKFFSPTASQKPTVGDIKMSAARVDHLGWLLCDGRTLNISEYPYLYEVIGVTYGGNTTQFTLPYPAGRVVGVSGSGVGLTSRNMGTSLGEETHTLTIPEMPSHNHTGTTNNSATAVTTSVTDPGHNHGGVPNQSSTAVNGLSNQTGNGGTTGSSTTGISVNIIDPTHNHTFTTDNTGGDVAHNNMQPTIFIGNMFIYCGVLKNTKYPFFGDESGNGGIY